MKFLPVLAVLIALSLTSTPAFAQSAELETVELTADDVEWDPDWDRIRAWEYVAAPTMLVAGLGSYVLLPAPDENVIGTPAVDREIYEAVRAPNQRAHDTWSLVGDVAFYGSMAYRLADVLIIGIAHEAWDVAWQVGWMDLESFSIIASSLWVPHYLGLGRERPGFSTCGDPDHYGEDCTRDHIRYRSFYAGHAAVAMAAAGQTCSHHFFLPIYGGGAGDAFACGAMIAVGALTGVARAVPGKHWPSDVLLGWGIGAASGWLVPLGLHYGFTRDPDRNDLRRVRLTPVMYGEHPGLVLHGGF